MSILYSQPTVVFWGRPLICLRKRRMSQSLHNLCRNTRSAKRGKDNGSSWVWQCWVDTVLEFVKKNCLWCAFRRNSMQEQASKQVANFYLCIVLKINVLLNPTIFWYLTFVFGRKNLTACNRYKYYEFPCVVIDKLYWNTDPKYQLKLIIKVLFVNYVQ